MKKEEHIDSFNAMGRLYEEKRPSGTRGFSDFNDLNRDLWAALIHRTSGEARKKIKQLWAGSGIVCIFENLALAHESDLYNAGRKSL